MSRWAHFQSLIFPQGGLNFKVKIQVKQYLPQIAERLAEDLSVDIRENETEDNYNLLGKYPSKYNKLIEVVVDTPDKDVIISAVLDVVESQKERKKQRQRSDAVLLEVSEANSHLQNAVIYTDDEKTSKSGVEEQLFSIHEAIRKIELWLENDA